MERTHLRCLDTKVLQNSVEDLWFPHFLRAQVQIAEERRSQTGSTPTVLAAGGIVCGRGLAAALALGCDGAVFGTRLWASEEALGQESFKAALTRAGPDDVARTTVFDAVQNTYRKAPWPRPYDSSGALLNSHGSTWSAAEGAEVLHPSGEVLGFRTL